MIQKQPSIRKLSPHLILQIAAGEVLERPASAVKELIENALDAEPSRINVSYKQGGLSLLEVEDDGRGISELDLPLAFEAHATSKLSKFEDFDALQSFGFRGEALASLGSVADSTIETGAFDASVAFRLRNNFGQQLPLEAIDRRKGTRVRVERIFERLPARLKFLKSERAEAQAMTLVWKRYALAYPSLAWSLEDLESGKKTALSPQSALERVLWFFDSDSPDQWYQAESKERDWKIKLIGLYPRFQGSCRSGFQIFLNNRPLKDIKLEMAIRRGYEGFTERPRDASVALFIEASPKLFDVNVHPQKHEVRFRNPDPLFSLIVHSIREKLSTEHRVPEVSERAVTIERPKAFSLSAATPFGELETAPAIDRPMLQQVPLLQFDESGYEFLGQVDQTYLICKRQNEIYLFDQHALHERILYEELRRGVLKENKLPSQRLLFPIRLNFELDESLVEESSVLTRLGFELREWNQSWQLLAVPSVLKREPEKALQEIAKIKEGAGEEILRNSLATIACHSAVRAHDVISREEIASLLKKFQSEDALGHCPHGRPTFIRLRVPELEKMFHRVL